MSERPRWLTVVAQGAVIVALFAVVGALGGWVWWQLWSPAPTGVVVEGTWYPRPATEGLTAEFAGTALYVVVALVGGLVLGVVAGVVLDRDELVTVGAVLLGSLVAAWLMREVGIGLSPPDPQGAAADAVDGTQLRGHLQIAGTRPLLAFPVGALVGLVVTLFGVSPGDRRSRPGRLRSR